MLVEEQGGFRSCRGCPDQIFILNEIIEKKCFEEKKNIFACFIDLQKAYDRVWRDGLWSKL